MEIRYKKRHLNINLIFSVIWFIYFFIIYFTKDELSWIDYGWIVFSFAYLATYFYQRKYKYLSIENGIIKVNGPFGKKLNLTEIKQIKSFAGDYILKSDSNELTINTQLMNPNSLAELNIELKKLNVEWK